MDLSSFRVGNCPGQLVRLARGGRRAAVIANALDAAPPEIRSEGVKRELDALTALGLVAEELDLRDYFGTGGPVASELRRYDIGWLRGGNVFVLRYAPARSGADAELTRVLGEDAIVYSGYSAGPCVLAPTLRGLETVDRAAVVEQLYREQPIWEGLGVLDYSIIPHVNSPEHPESKALGLVAQAVSTARNTAQDAPRRRGPHHTDGDALGGLHGGSCAGQQMGAHRVDGSTEPPKR
jgi:dipeptidase E